MAREGKASTLPVHFRELVRRAIIQGDYPPGSRLAPSVLAKKYETSTTVIRETLMGLVLERMVVFKPNQGFFVLKLSIKELEDLTLVRANSDTLALKLAIERGDMSWEVSVLGAFHQLSRTPRRYQSGPSGPTEEWSRAHRAFHVALIEGCHVPMLIESAGALFDATELYRRWTAPPANPTRDVDSEHRQIMEAALNRDTDAGCRLLSEHYHGTFAMMRDSGLVEDATSGDNDKTGRWH